MIYYTLDVFYITQSSSVAVHCLVFTRFHKMRGSLCYGKRTNVKFYFFSFQRPLNMMKVSSRWSPYLKLYGKMRRHTNDLHNPSPNDVCVACMFHNINNTNSDTIFASYCTHNIMRRNQYVHVGYRHQTGVSPQLNSVTVKQKNSRMFQENMARKGICILF